MKRIGIIGGGFSALMLAYDLGYDEFNQFEITIFEKGHALESRKCPVLNSSVSKCLKCKSCAIMEGLGGAGAFSDGKYNITSEFGGWLGDFISSEDVIKYEEVVDHILSEHGATTLRYKPDNQLKKLCLQHDLHMQQSECRHLGTDLNFKVMKNLINTLTDIGVTIKTDCCVTDVIDKDDKKLVKYSTSVYSDEKEFDIVVFAVGRSGSQFFSNWCISNNVPLYNNQVDIGVRVELPSTIWEDFEEKIYEPKIWYKTKQYGDRVRMFCFNGRGEVVNENTSGIITVNGHAYESKELKTESSNFALLSTCNFTEPFKEPIKYARHIAELSNMIGGGNVIVQTLGDLRRGRRTNEHRLKQCSTKQTLLTATPGDLSLCIPKRQLDNILEMLEKLDEIAPGTNNDDTLLYGVECKYYSSRPACNKHFEIKPGIYAIGDGCGFTRSLAQAGAQGLVLGEYLIESELTNNE